MTEREQYAEQLKTAVPKQIRKTFHAIAKTAMQGSSEADDPSLNVFDKMRKAHACVTLIVDDAMRGLRELHEEMVRLVLLIGVSDDKEGADPLSLH